MRRDGPALEGRQNVAQGGARLRGTLGIGRRERPALEGRQSPGCPRNHCINSCRPLRGLMALTLRLPRIPRCRASSWAVFCRPVGAGCRPTLTIQARVTEIEEARQKQMNGGHGQRLRQNR
jgi:hypothetical protein